jgi:hypothetical protein
MGCGGGLICHRYAVVSGDPSLPTTSRSIYPGGGGLGLTGGGTGGSPVAGMDSMSLNNSRDRRLSPVREYRA